MAAVATVKFNKKNGMRKVTIFIFFIIKLATCSVLCYHVSTLSQCIFLNVNKSFFYSHNNIYCSFESDTITKLDDNIIVCF